MDQHSFFYGSGHLLQGSRIMIFTIGDDHQGLVLLLFLGEGGAGHGNGLGDHRSLSLYVGWIDKGKHHAHRSIIYGDGNLKIGPTGEDDQSYPVSFQLVHHTQDHLLCPTQSIRTDIPGQHAVAHVQGKDDVHPLPLHLLGPQAHLKIGPAEDEQAKGNQYKDKPKAATPGYVPQHLLGDQSFFTQGLSDSSSPAQVCNKQQNQDRDQNERH